MFLIYTTPNQETVVYDALEQVNYRFRVLDNKLYYILDDVPHLVIEQTAKTYMRRDFSILTAHSEETLKSTTFKVPEQFLNEVKYDNIEFKDYHEGIILPNNPFAIYTPNTGLGVEKIDHMTSDDQRIRSQVFRRILFDHLKNKLPCQNCGQVFRSQCCRSTLNCSVDHYEWIHQCGVCAVKSDNIFQIEMTDNGWNLTEDAKYEFYYQEDDLCLKYKGTDYLIFTRDLHEDLNDPQRCGYFLKPIIMGRQLGSEPEKLKWIELGGLSSLSVASNESYFPDRPLEIVFNDTRYEYFRDLVERLVHMRPCVRCHKHNMPVMKLKEDTYTITSICDSCKDFEQSITTNVDSIVIKINEIPFKFTLHNGRVYFDGKVVISLFWLREPLLMLFDPEHLEQVIAQLKPTKSGLAGCYVDMNDQMKEAETQWRITLKKEGTIFPWPEGKVTLGTTRNIYKGKTTSVDLKYEVFLSELLRLKISNLVPCAECGGHKEKVISGSFFEHGCYSIYGVCQDCVV